MVYDLALAERIRSVLNGQAGLHEKKMFGGVAFMINGNMACGITNTRLMVRVGPQQYNETLALPHAHELELGGRPMTGMVVVEPDGFVADDALAEWISRGVRFAVSLPPK